MTPVTAMLSAIATIERPSPSPLDTALAKMRAAPDGPEFAAAVSGVRDAVLAAQGYREPLAELEACKAKLAVLETFVAGIANEDIGPQPPEPEWDCGNSGDLASAVGDLMLWRAGKFAKDQAIAALAAAKADPVDALRDRNAYAKKLCLMVLMRYSPLDTLALQGGIMGDRKVAMEEFELVFLRALTEATAAANGVQT